MRLIFPRCRHAKRAKSLFCHSKGMNLICPKHRFTLERLDSEDAYRCPSGCNFPIISNIPRFTPMDNYAASFGLQWNKFRTAQLDSYTRTSISRDRLMRLVGGSLEIFKGKSVLEAGCGAGRFTEIMLATGAKVFAADLSTAVEANYQNCKEYPDYFVCQGDILDLPVLPEQFDIVVCIGVIQHTPDPEASMAVLCTYVKPGGLLVIDHYTYGYPITSLRRALRSFLLKKSKTFSMRFCQALTAILWPIHKILWKMKAIAGIESLRSRFIRYSPIVDYYQSYPQLNTKLLYEWAVLDTHDTLTDCHKHLRRAEEIKYHLESCEMVEVEAVYAGNGVEARARKRLKAQE